MGVDVAVSSARRGLWILAIVLLAVSGFGPAHGAAEEPEPRVVGGADAALGQIPYQVSIQSNGFPFCGGSVVSPTVVLTAAHCVDDLAPGSADQVDVVAGFTDQNQQQAQGAQSIAVASFAMHPDYEPSPTSDVAVLVLSQPFAFSANLQPIPLASATDLSQATTGRVSGWGDTSSGGSASSTLKAAIVPIYDDETCETDYSMPIVPAIEVCAGGVGGIDTCQGDSGGPLAIEVGGGWKLAGVTSWGFGCAEGTPGVYAEVSGALLTWISSQIPQPPAATCDGKPVTIDMNTNGGSGFGTAGDDVILGTPEGDTINGLGGHDTICSGAGDDTVMAGAGNDRVFGGEGSDTVFGATGNDWLSGGDGNDTITGQGGLDTIYGLAGADNVWGMGANDFIYGGTGADKLRGNGGVDKVWGGPGLDQIWGGNLGDFLYGEGTRDIIRGGGGPDVIEGGAGNDDLFGENNTDTLTGGTGVDTFDGGLGIDSCTDVAGGESAVSC